MSPVDTTQTSRWSHLLTVLEVLGWMVLVVTAVGSSIVVQVLVDIDCNGLWGERPDQACMDSTSWMALIPFGVLALLVVARVKVGRRTTGRRAARGGDR